MAFDLSSLDHLGLSPDQLKAVGFLAEFTKRMVITAFSGQRTPVQSLNLIQEVYRVTDEMMAGCIKDRSMLPCKKGCSWCCSLRVKVTPLEMLCVAGYLQSHLNTDEMAALRMQLEIAENQTRESGGDQKFLVKQGCPVLKDGSCLAYPVRPIACRTYHSLNSSDCTALLNNIAGSVTIRRDIAGLSIGIFAGLTEGLRTIGLPTRLLELKAGMRIAIQENTNGLAESWLSGEPSFAQAEFSNAKDIEHYHHTLLKELGKNLAAD